MLFCHWLKPVVLALHSRIHKKTPLKGRGCSENDSYKLLAYKNRERGGGARRTGVYKTYMRIQVRRQQSYREKSAFLEVLG